MNLSGKDKDDNVVTLQEVLENDERSVEESVDLKMKVKLLYEKIYCTSLYFYPDILLLIINISSVDDLCGYFVTSIFTKEILRRLNHKIIFFILSDTQERIFLFFLSLIFQLCKCK